MRRVSKFSISVAVKYSLFTLILIIAGCSLEKQSGFNRSMQNLTAHYNILFNAKEILRQKQESYAASFIDNYNELLSVYPDTIAQSKTPDKDLEEAIVKANKIINIKEQSHYLSDAYLVMGKAYYLEANYFNASEYFSYVIRSFSKRIDLTQEALVWKARTLIYLDKLPEAKLALDSAIKNINPKKRITADVYASKLQYDINTQDYAESEEMAKQAIHFSEDKMQRLRWTYILAQLQELNHKPLDAITNYSKVAKSNVEFEMAFNASLNRIRIEDTRDGVKTNRTARLLSLLKDPNNKEFKDQIYYQVAQIQMADKNIDGAIKSYNQSIRSSLRNQNQKGLSYLRLAEIYFNNKADYLRSKKYYDSTLTTLPINYPGYLAIQKKGNNLQLLADKLLLIAREDTLQALARMDEQTRLKVIDKMVSDRIAQQKADIIAANATAANNSDPDAALSNNTGNGSLPGNNKTGTKGAANNGGSSFYFDNNSAVGQGYADFKRKWGNRKLEDNWRRSSRSNSDITSNSVNKASTDPDAPIVKQGASTPVANAGNYRQELMQGLPLTPEKLAQSNLRVYAAYVDIGNYYRDLLDDKKDAIAAFELVLRRFPDDSSRPAIYYSLYRLYSDLDQAKADLYKNKLLKEYPSTPFAKVIADPDYLKKLDSENAAFTQAYNDVFDKYSRKQYKEVITSAPQVLKQYPGNKFSSQLYYLQTLAEGHNEKIGPFQDSLKQIVKRFPDDKLITPLVKQHLTYIDSNQTELQSRTVVLVDDNPQDIPFTLNPENSKQASLRPKAVPFANTPQPVAVRPQETPIVTTAPTQTTKLTTPLLGAQTIKPTSIPQTYQPEVKPPEVSSVFSKRDSSRYYFVVNVNNGTTNLSSSRFGIGQFNRTNYAGKGIRHQLLPVEDDNQLIYVGLFPSLDAVKKYAHDIVPLLPDIMKVPKDKYSFFIVTQENLDKLADKKTLDSYMDYYQKSY